MPERKAKGDLRRRQPNPVPSCRTPARPALNLRSARCGRRLPLLAGLVEGIGGNPAPEHRRASDAAAQSADPHAAMRALAQLPDGPPTGHVAAFERRILHGGQRSVLGRLRWLGFQTGVASNAESAGCVTFATSPCGLHHCASKGQVIAGKS